jgi:hypothetical protein
MTRCNLSETGRHPPGVVEGGFVFESTRSRDDSRTVPMSHEAILLDLPTRGILSLLVVQSYSRLASVLSERASETEGKKKTVMTGQSWTGRG